MYVSDYSIQKMSDLQEYTSKKGLSGWLYSLNQQDREVQYYKEINYWSKLFKFTEILFHV